MEFQWWPAFVAGVIGGAVMVVMRTMLKAAGVDLKMDIALIWGTMFGLHGTAGRVVGLVFHLAVSGLIGLLYAWAFATIVGVPDNLWLWGLVGGAIHWVIAGLFMAILPAMHPEVPEQRPAPGAFVKSFGAPDVPAFLMGHLLYGGVVGTGYALLHSGGGPSVAF